jgi:hypothetical protein
MLRKQELPCCKHSVVALKKRALSRTGVHQANPSLNGSAASPDVLSELQTPALQIRWLTTKPPCASTSHVPDNQLPQSFFFFEIKWDKGHGLPRGLLRNRLTKSLITVDPQVISRRLVLPLASSPPSFTIASTSHTLDLRSTSSQDFEQMKSKLLNNIPPTKPVQRTSMARVWEKLASLGPTRQTKWSPLPAFNSKPVECYSHPFRLCVWYWVLFGCGVTISTLGVRITVHYIALKRKHPPNLNLYLFRLTCMTLGVFWSWSDHFHTRCEDQCPPYVVHALPKI